MTRRAPRRRGRRRTARSACAPGRASHRPAAGRGLATRALRTPARGGWAERHSLDGGLVASSALLTGLGIVMIYSATAPLAIEQAFPREFARHLLAAALALVCAFAASRTPIALWRRASLSLWSVSVALLLVTLVIGVEVKGARRWLAVPGLPLTFQPAELAKWASVLAVATYLARGRGPGWMRSSPLLAALGLGALPAVLLLAQPDFGNAALLLALVGFLLFASGIRLRQLALPAAVAALGGVLYVAAKPYALQRWKGFLDPWQTAGAEGFQLVQSFVAFGRGGVLGVGLGDGRQKLFYLPEAHTDFILSVVAEEIGLVGVLVVLGGFAAWWLAGTRIARRARDRFALLVAFGMTALIALPAAVNAAVVMGLLPTTGFPLPFLSFGGTALITNGLALGILLRIGAREAPPRRVRIAAAEPRGLVRT